MPCSGALAETPEKPDLASAETKLLLEHNKRTQVRFHDRSRWLPG
jgi:hypothetical protein